MKKAFTAFIIIMLLGGIFLVGKSIYKKKAYDNYIKEIEKGWHVEILTDILNVREYPTKYSNALKTVEKGEKFKVLEFKEDEAGNYYWYKIEFYDKTLPGWVANNTKGTYLKDVGNKEDIAIPIIQFHSDPLKVLNIESINPSKLVKNGELYVWDDRNDYEITFTIYHETEDYKGEDNYWIQWKIEDKSGKSSTKLQAITFEETPDESLVKPFTDCKRRNGDSC